MKWSDLATSFKVTEVIQASDGVEWILFRMPDIVLVFLSNSPT